MFFYGGGGVRVAGAWRLLMDQMDQMDQMDKMGAPRYTLWVCMPLFGMAQAKDVPLGYAGFFMAAAVCVLRGRGAC